MAESVEDFSNWLFVDRIVGHKNYDMSTREFRKNYASDLYIDYFWPNILEKYSLDIHQEQRDFIPSIPTLKIPEVSKSVLDMGIFKNFFDGFKIKFDKNDNFLIVLILFGVLLLVEIL